MNSKLIYKSKLTGLKMKKTELERLRTHSTIKNLQEKCATLEMKVEDQENRGWRSDLGLVSFHEKAEICVLF